MELQAAAKDLEFAKEVLAGMLFDRDVRKSRDPRLPGWIQEQAALVARRQADLDRA